METFLKDNTLIITNYSNKINILKKLNKENRLLKINFLDKQELIKKYYFTYDEKAIYYLMKNYNLNREIAGIYLKNMYYVENKEYKSDKLNTLSKLKQDLESNNLLIKDDLFIKYIQNKKIIFYRYSSFSKLEKNLIENLKKYTEVEIIEKPKQNYKHKVYEFNTLEEEVEFIARSILKLLEQNISIKDIKLTNIDGDYYDTLTRIFEMYNLRVSLKDSKLISTQIAKDYLNETGSIEEIINKLTEKYKNNKILDQITKIVNKYIDFSDQKIVKEMITYDFKNTYLKKDTYQNEIEIIDYLEDYISESTYVFMPSFNQNKIPKIHKDEDFITDSIKENLILDTTLEKNKREKQDTIKAIESIKNLIITYKNTSITNTYYPSNLISDLKLEVEKKEIDYTTSYSTVSDKINLTKYLDKYSKTGEIDKNLKLLYNSYNDIEYNTYDNKYKKVDKNILKEYLDNKFNLSYSSMDSFYKCPFRYYLSHILKLDIYEEKFEAYIGSMFHYVLEKSLKDKEDINDLITKFINTNERNLSKKERFFINKLSKELFFIHETILNHLENTELTDMLFEERVEVVKKGDITVTFKGFIDKVMYKKENNKTVVAIIDYKTGQTDINLGFVPYGLSMQLPVYLYLAEKSKKLENIEFAGFYLQRILSGPYQIDEKKTLEEQKKESLLLYGYSNNDEEVLHKFDKTYKESKFIKSMKLTKDGHFNRFAKILNSEEINTLIDITDQKINEAIKEITECNFNISPKRTEKANLGCKFCSYSDICFKETKDEILIKEDKDLSYLRGIENA